MPETVLLTGGCLCGAVRYECQGRPEAASYCHCPDCRKATGGPFTVGVTADAETLIFRSGRTKGYTKVADSGKRITREFCPACGSPLLTRAEACPGLVWIKAGSLDGPELVRPSHHSWVQMAVSWAYADKDLPAFTGNGPAPAEEIA